MLTGGAKQPAQNGAALSAISAVIDRGLWPPTTQPRHRNHAVHLSAILQSLFQAWIFVRGRRIQSQWCLWARCKGYEPRTELQRHRARPSR
jgi:hypothetical protein